jgi:hypothetical protein
VRSVLKEAGSELASRRTEIGYEALQVRANRQMAARLSRRCYGFLSIGMANNCHNGVKNNLFFIIHDFV